MAQHTQQSIQLIKRYESCQSWDSITSNRPRNFILSLKYLFAFDAQPTRLSNCQCMAMLSTSFRLLTHFVRLLACSLTLILSIHSHQYGLVIEKHFTIPKQKHTHTYTHIHRKIRTESHLQLLVAGFNFGNGFLCSLNFSLKAFARVVGVAAVSYFCFLFSSSLCFSIGCGICLHSICSHIQNASGYNFFLSLILSAAVRVVNGRVVIFRFA